MKKAVLVMDMPKNCRECRLKYDCELRYICTNPLKGKYRIDVTKHVQNETKSDWCPLKEAPDVIPKEYPIEIDDYDWGYRRGWNDCIDEILGE